jgi:hypothetical protein
MRRGGSYDTHHPSMVRGAPRPGGLLSLAVEAQSHPLRQLVVVGTVAGDGALHGVLTITGLALNETGQLVATGTLAGTAGTQVIQETWTALATQFRQGEGSDVCTQLLLDLAPAHLDGVGLTVEVARLTLRPHCAARTGRVAWAATLRADVSPGESLDARKWDAVPPERHQPTARSQGGLQLE